MSIVGAFALAFSFLLGGLMVVGIIVGAFVLSRLNALEELVSRQRKEFDEAITRLWGKFREFSSVIQH